VAGAGNARPVRGDQRQGDRAALVHAQDQGQQGGTGPRGTALAQAARELTLTALGRKAYREIVPKAVEFERRILDELGSETELFLAALDRLEKTFKAR
jgi:hypothetical protein